MRPVFLNKKILSVLKTMSVLVAATKSHLLDFYVRGSKKGFENEFCQSELS